MLRLISITFERQSPMIEPKAKWSISPGGHRLEPSMTRANTAQLLSRASTFIAKAKLWTTSVNPSAVAAVSATSVGKWKKQESPLTTIKAPTTGDAGFKLLKNSLVEKAPRSCASPFPVYRDQITIKMVAQMMTLIKSWKFSAIFDPRSNEIQTRKLPAH